MTESRVSSPAVAKQLRHIAVEDDTTVQALLEEALDLLFAKKGKRYVRDLD
ncbi:ribbon-helix-helix domain-containing protein [Roseibium sp. RKSG952]|uniref:ribbon-helix-helix domain-containing protein n=1 Tax=Roseibium sp. RKSG952 TaxID=2529384 RepID=UPI0012BCCD31|nr:ribbon-helix-helix domain-containing protein [Roseibium sp. RKSG952]